MLLPPLLPGGACDPDRDRRRRRGLVLIGAYVCAPQEAAHAQVEGGRQVVDITVKGGHSPNLVRVEAG